MSSSTMAQAKVTDYYRRMRSHRSPSPKRSKTPLDSRTPVVPKTPTIKRSITLVDQSNLELPASYSLLIQQFSGADQIVSIMYNRQELITFTKLKCGVQNLTRRNFGLNQLGQIKTIYPEAYVYEQIRMTRQEGILQNRPVDYELTVKPNLNDDLSAYGMKTPHKSPRKPIDTTPTKTPPRTPIKRPYFAFSPMKTPPKCSPQFRAVASPASPSKIFLASGVTKPFTGERLVARSQIFRRNLFGILCRRHKDFLLALSPPIELNEDEESRLTSWHPKFLADETALQIDASELPKPPAVEKVASAKHLLFSTGTLLQKTAAAKSVTNDQSSETGKSEQPATSKASSSRVKGIPPTLLAKIREKESQKKRLAMLRSPEEETQRLRSARLPDFIRIINMYFATEGKTVLSLPQVYKKLTDSYATPMAQSEIEEHVKMLRDMVPDWISFSTLGDKGAYLRLNREMDVTDVLKVLEKK